MAGTLRYSLLITAVAVFIAHDVSCNKAKPANDVKLCPDYPDIVVERSLDQTGFHRELHIAIHTRNKPKTKGRPPVLLLDQAVPSGAFIDPHQLRLLDDGDAEFAVPDRVDVERLQHEASPHRLYAFVALNSSQSDVSLPVHLRYHRARQCLSEGAFSTVTLQPPVFYFRLPDSEFADDCEELHRLPCTHSDLEKMCTWKRFHVDGVSDLKAEVPVGCLEDSFVVSTVTLVTYSLCSVAVAYFIVIHGKKQRPD
ncbi:unnamed protein product [Ixodes hexagonus]